MVLYFCILLQWTVCNVEIHLELAQFDSKSRNERSLMLSRVNKQSHETKQIMTAVRLSIRIGHISAAVQFNASNINSFYSKCKWCVFTCKSILAQNQRLTVLYSCSSLCLFKAAHDGLITDVYSNDLRGKECDSTGQSP